METKGLEGGCLQALSALAMTRMYYDGSMDDRSALIEEQRILDKSLGLSEKEAGPRSAHGDEDRGHERDAHRASSRSPGKRPKRLVSQTPRAAAKEQLLEAKVEMRASLRSGESKLRSEAEDRKGKIQRIAAVSGQPGRCSLMGPTAGSSTIRQIRKDKEAGNCPPLLHHPLEHGAEQPDEKAQRDLKRRLEEPTKPLHRRHPNLP